MSKMNFRAKLANNIFKIADEDAKDTPISQRGFNPYAVNNGTVAAIAGKDF